MSGSRYLIAGAFLAAILAAGDVRAQSVNNPNLANCGSSTRLDIFGYGDCVRHDINREIQIQTTDAVARAVANSFGIGPTGVEPAGLSTLTPAEFGQRLDRGSAIIVSPTADAVPAAATPKWNLWGDAKYTWNDYDIPFFDIDGGLWNGLAGIDYKITDRLTLGLLGSYERADLGEGIESTGWGVGPYLGFVITDNIVFSASMLGTWLDGSQSPFIDYDSERLQAAASLNGYWYFGMLRVTPGVSLSWSKEWLDTEGGLPDQTIETAMLTPSLQLGNSFRLGAAATIEPWAGAAFDYVFVNDTEIDGFGGTEDSYSDLRLQAGFNFGLGNHAQLAITGELGGLLQDDLDTYAVEANLAIQF